MVNVYARTLVMDSPSEKCSVKTITTQDCKSKSSQMASFTCCPAGKVVQNKCDGKCIVQDNGYNSPSEKCSVKTITTQDCKSKSSQMASFTCCPAGKVVQNKCDGKCIVQDNGYNSPSEKCSVKTITTQDCTSKSSQMASFTCCPAGKVVQNKCDGKCIVQDNGYNSPSEK